MFYPCIYMFVIWDAYKGAGGGRESGYIRFVSAAYCGTIGVIYSETFTPFNILLGPIWLGIVGLLFGVWLGTWIEHWLEGKVHEQI